MKVLFFLLVFILIGFRLNAQDVEVDKFEAGFSVKGFILPKPNIIINTGDNVIDPKNNFGLEYGLEIRYKLFENLFVSSSFHLGRSNVSFFIDNQFVENWAKSLNIDYTSEDIKKVKREYRPSISYVYYRFSDFNINLKYDFFRFNNLDVGFYSGFNIISFRQSYGYSYRVFFEYEDEDEDGYILPFYQEYSMNAHKIYYRKLDLGVNIGLFVNQIIHNYHNINLTVGMTWIPRYLLFAEYSVYTPSGFHEGSIIQSSTMFNIGISYYLNWAAITHYGKD